MKGCTILLLVLIVHTYSVHCENWGWKPNPEEWGNQKRESVIQKLREMYAKRSEEDGYNIKDFLISSKSWMPEMKKYSFGRDLDSSGTKGHSELSGSMDNSDSKDKSGSLDSNQGAELDSNNNAKDSSKGTDSADEANLNDGSNNNDAPNTTDESNSTEETTSKDMDTFGTDRVKQKKAYKSKISTLPAHLETQFSHFLENLVPKAKDTLQLVEMVENRKLEPYEGISSLKTFYKKLYDLNKARYKIWKKEMEMKKYVLGKLKTAEPKTVQKLCEMKPNLPYTLRSMVSGECKDSASMSEGKNQGELSESGKLNTDLRSEVSSAMEQSTGSWNTLKKPNDIDTDMKEVTDSVKRTQSEEPFGEKMTTSMSTGKDLQQQIESSKMSIDTNPEGTTVQENWTGSGNTQKVPDNVKPVIKVITDKLKNIVTKELASDKIAASMSAGQTTQPMESSKWSTDTKPEGTAIVEHWTGSGMVPKGIGTVMDVITDTLEHTSGNEPYGVGSTASMTAGRTLHLPNESSKWNTDTKPEGTTMVGNWAESEKTQKVPENVQPVVKAITDKLKNMATKELTSDKLAGSMSAGQTTQPIGSNKWGSDTKPEGTTMVENWAESGKTQKVPENVQPVVKAITDKLKNMATKELTSDKLAGSMSAGQTTQPIGSNKWGSDTKPEGTTTVEHWTGGVKIPKEPRGIETAMAAITDTIKQMSDNEPSGMGSTASMSAGNTLQQPSGHKLTTDLNPEGTTILEQLLGSGKTSKEPGKLEGVVKGLTDTVKNLPVKDLLDDKVSTGVSVGNLDIKPAGTTMVENWTGDEKTQKVPVDVDKVVKAVTDKLKNVATKELTSDKLAGSMSAGQTTQPIGSNKWGSDTKPEGTTMVENWAESEKTQKVPENVQPVVKAITDKLKNMATKELTSDKLAGSMSAGQSTQPIGSNKWGSDTKPEGTTMVENWAESENTQKVPENVQPVVKAITDKLKDMATKELTSDKLAGSMSAGQTTQPIGSNKWGSDTKPEGTTTVEHWTGGVKIPKEPRGIETAMAAITDTIKQMSDNEPSGMGSTASMSAGNTLQQPSGNKWTTDLNPEGTTILEQLLGSGTTSKEPGKLEGVVKGLTDTVKNLPVKDLLDDKVSTGVSVGNLDIKPAGTTMVENWTGDEKTQKVPVDVDKVVKAVTDKLKNVATKELTSDKIAASMSAGQTTQPIGSSKWGIDTKPEGTTMVENWAGSEKTQKVPENVQPVVKAITDKLKNMATKELTSDKLAGSMSAGQTTQPMESSKLNTDTKSEGTTILEHWTPGVKIPREPYNMETVMKAISDAVSNIPTEELSGGGNTPSMSAGKSTQQPGGSSTWNTDLNPEGTTILEQLLGSGKTSNEPGKLEGVVKGLTDTVKNLPVKDLLDDKASTGVSVGNLDTKPKGTTMVENWTGDEKTQKVPVDVDKVVKAITDKLKNVATKELTSDKITASMSAGQTTQPIGSSKWDIDTKPEGTTMVENWTGDEKTQKVPVDVDKVVKAITDKLKNVATKELTSDKITASMSAGQTTQPMEGSKLNTDAKPEGTSISEQWTGRKVTPSEPYNMETIIKAITEAIKNIPNTELSDQGNTASIAAGKSTQQLGGSGDWNTDLSPEGTTMSQQLLENEKTLKEQNKFGILRRLVGKVKNAPIKGFLDDKISAGMSLGKGTQPSESRKLTTELKPEGTTILEQVLGSEKTSKEPNKLEGVVKGLIGKVKNLPVKDLVDGKVSTSGKLDAKPEGTAMVEKWTEGEKTPEAPVDMDNVVKAITDKLKNVATKELSSPGSTGGTSEPGKSDTWDTKNTSEGPAATKLSTKGTSEILAAPTWKTETTVNDMVSDKNIWKDTASKEPITTAETYSTAETKNTIRVVTTAATVGNLLLEKK